MPLVTAPPQPPEPPPPAPPPAPPPVPKFSGHVASYRAQAEAKAAWPSLVQRFPILKDEPKRYLEIDLGGGRGKVVRLLVGNFVEYQDVMTYCHRLRSAGIFCAPHDLPPAESEKSAS